MSDEIFDDGETPIVVVSRESKLLPLAHRLRNVERHPTTVMMWKKSFEAAWDGMITKDVKSSDREIHKESITDLVQKAKNGDIVIVHDVPNLEDSFDEAAGVYGIRTLESSESPIRLGFWWDGQTEQAEHLLIYDMGAWANGMGMKVPAALTLINTSEGALQELWTKLFTDEARQFLRGLNFRGLVNVGLIEDKGELILSGWEMGWPDLHTQVFMGAVANNSWGGLLVHREIPRLWNMFTFGLVLSVPPWPGTHHPNARGKGIQGVPIGLNDKLHEYVYWHDVNVNVETKSLTTAGTDGLVGIVHANANCFENAKQKALGVAGMIELVDKQFRMDVGNGVRVLEAQLEDHYGVTF